jgi:hypothetical protein
MRRGALLVILSGLSGCGRFGFDADPPTDQPPPPPVDGKVRVTIKHNGGDGTVVGPNGFTCTTGQCTLDLDPGTAINFRGLAAAGAWFAGWTGPCGGNFDCDVIVDADVTIVADFTPTPNRVFVASTPITGALGGIAGGDAICAARATAAGLNGTFIAYLSSSTLDAPSRLSTSRGWVRTDGAPFADSPSSLTTGEIVFPARLDELGSDLGDPEVFTGTEWGVKTVETCADWTSADNALNGSVNEVKLALDLPRSWGLGCGNEAHLLCVEIGRVQPVMTRPDTGRRAFATINGWQPGGGRDSADAHCAAEASLAGRNGTFLAAIATTTESIASRFPTDAIYRRIDGVRLSRAAGLWTSEWFDVPPQIDQFGDLISADFWTGANRFDALPQAADNCNDWTSNSDTLGGFMHLTTNSDLREPWKTDPCDTVVPLLCLEN